MSIFGECFSNVNRRKTLHGNSESSSTFRRCLNTIDLTYIGLGSMLGTGLFVVGGEVAKNIAGPAVVVSFALGAIAALLSAYCYAEFSSQITRTGSAYIYAYVSIGEVWAYIIGWNMVLEYIAMLSSVSRAMSATIDSVIDFKIQNAITHYFLNDEPWKSSFLSEYPDLFAGALVIFVTILVSFGAKISSTVTFICINMLFVIVVMMIVVAFYYGDVNNLTKDGGYFPFGIEGVLEGAAVCFMTYSGFEVICISSEECTSPRKSIPIALGAALAVVSVTYLIVSGSLTYLVTYKEIIPDAAFSAAFIEKGLDWMGYIVTIGVILAGFTSLITGSYFLARLIYALSVDGLFFKAFSNVSQTSQVPVMATIAFGTMSAALAILVKYDVLVKCLSIGTLCAYTIMSGAVIILRYRPKSKDSLFVDYDDATTLFTQTEGADDNGEYVYDLTGRLKNSFNRLPLLSKLEPGAAVPYALLGFVFCLGAGLLLINNFPDLLSTVPVAILTIVLFILSLMSFVIIPLHHHSFNEGKIQVPFVPFLPAFSITINIILMTQLDHLTWLRFILWIAIGMAIYCFYGYWHSEEGKTDEQSPNITENGPTAFSYGSLDNEREIQY
ncbi:cationic amino acid transporter 4-like [Antedon mediterranea]|uniref:cationic amino acid transporter 4-like n=1 Tax=Antedon mediterranea TaxID=105859 RepID=UPI003AF90461